MGKGIIKSGGDDGSYHVKLLLHVESIIEEQKFLSKKLEKLLEEIKNLKQKIEDLIVSELDDEGDPELDDEGDPELDDEGDPELDDEGDPELDDEGDDEGDPEPEEEPEPGAYSMGGQITNGAGIPDIEISIFWYDAGRWKNIHTLFSGPTGFWEIETIEAGKYKLRFKDPLGNYATTYWLNKATLTSATIISITGDRTDLNISLQLKASIQGKVTDT